jgi:hypothetical protein
LPGEGAAVAVSFEGVAVTDATGRRASGAGAATAVGAGY